MGRRRLLARLVLRLRRRAVGAGRRGVVPLFTAVGLVLGALGQAAVARIRPALSGSAWRLSAEPVGGLLPGSCRFRRCPFVSYATIQRRRRR